MISLLVSSKTMKPTACTLAVEESQPVFREEADALNALLKAKSPLQLRRLMHISPKIADSTYELIQNWGESPTAPSWYSFVGDVYKGLTIEQFNESDLEFAQQHMGTLSGLYGFLRPLDQIHPYRLELGNKLKGKIDGGSFNNLYEFWGDKITRSLPKNEPIVNISSEEYIKVIQPYVQPDQIITPWFMQIKNGVPEFQAVHAKYARGTIARWICKNRVNDPDRLPDFAEDRYLFDSKLSAPNKPVFTREFIPVAIQR